ncbi:MAG TPA: HK97 gp10 family phage protein [Actinomycetota bacterium]|jgi:hypothetical protein|nr:HK97 gp10 family phage protein [Actinomycetota bacterium]
MADEARVEVHGYPQLAAGSARLFSRIGPEAEDRFGQVADQVAGVVRGRVPHRSGRLASSVETGRAEPHGVTVGIGAGVPYAGWIEFGGSRGRPYVSGGRYLFPTAEAAEPLVYVAGQEAAWEAIKEARWPRPTL